MVRNRQHIVLALILLLAATLRFTALDWDGYQHYHPDERYVTWVATTIEFPGELTDAFDPQRSSFNPFYWPPDAQSEGIVVLQDQPRSFAYGHLPLYLGVLATKVVERVSPFLITRLPAHWPLTQDLLNGGAYNEFHHLTAVSRALTALFDLGTVWLVYLLAARLYGATAGLLAATFLALNVMHIQLARFFTVDPYLTFFSVAAVYASVRAASASTQRHFRRNAVLAAIAIGLAVGSKFSAILLFLPLLFALWLQKDGNRHLLRRAILVTALIAALTFVVTNPFALLDWSCDVVSPALQVGPLGIPPMDWGSCYMDNVLRQSAMVRGDEAFDFTRQYVGTLPYLYPLLMQLRWGMGYALGIVALAGFALAVVTGIEKIRRVGGVRLLPEKLSGGRAELVVLAWTVPYFVVTGSFFVKFMRYMQPLTPFLMVYAAALLLKRLKGGRQKAAIVVVFAVTALYAFAFIRMYGHEHPWNEASRWMYQHVAPGSLIASELWDDPLPSSMVIDDEFHNRHMYDYTELTWLSGTGTQDDEEKLKLNLSRLAQADYLTISSNRGYGVVSRLEYYYPLSHQYYEQLFSGDLGFEAVMVAGRSPQLGPFAIWPDRFGQTGLELPPTVQDFLRTNVMISPGKADESFTVYDQPLAIIFSNQGGLTVDQMLEQFDLATD